MVNLAEQLRALQRAHAPALVRYTASLIGDRGRAEDIVQETLLRAWLRPQLLNQSTSPRAWLFTVARNLVVDEQRSARHRREVAMASTPERSNQDHDQYDRALDAELIADALATLSDNHRAVIVLSYYQGLSTKEIADRLDIAEGTVKSRLHYGIAKLRAALNVSGRAAEPDA